MSKKFLPLAMILAAAITTAWLYRRQPNKTTPLAQPAATITNANDQLLHGSKPAPAMVMAGGFDVDKEVPLHVPDGERSVWAYVLTHERPDIRDRHDYDLSYRLFAYSSSSQTWEKIFEQTQSLVASRLGEPNIGVERFDLLSFDPKHADAILIVERQQNSIHAANWFLLAYTQGHWRKLPSPLSRQAYLAKGYIGHNTVDVDKNQIVETFPIRQLKPPTAMRQFFFSFNGQTIRLDHVNFYNLDLPTGLK